MTNAPHDTKTLVGSKWTRCEPENKRKHWEVVEYSSGDGVVIRAVIDGESIEIPWRQLRNRDVWMPGWR